MRKLFLLLILLGSCDQELDNEKTKLTEDFTKLYQKGLDDRVSPLERKSYLNKALKLLDRNDSLRANLLYSKCNLHLALEEYDSLFTNGKRLVRLAKKSKQNGVQGKYYHLMAYYYRTVRGNLDSSFIYHKRAKNLFSILNDSLQIGRRLLSMGIIQKNQNDFFGAKETLTEALSYLEGGNDERFLASVYNELATNYRKLLNYEDAVTYYQSAIETSPSAEDVLIYFNNKGVVHTEMGEFPKAISFFEFVLDKPLSSKNQKQYARILHNLTYAKWKNGEHNVANDFFRALEIRRKENDRRGQISSYTDLGEYYSKTNPKTANLYLDSVIQLSKKLKTPRAETDALKLLMQLEPKNTVFKDRYIFLKDSLYQQELKVKTQFAKMRYDDQQEKEQILRLEAETLQKQTELAEAKTQQVLYLSLSGLLVIAGTSLYYVLRQRHRKEKLREVYRTEKMISQRLHDELSNDIFGLMANVEQRPDKNTPYLLDGLEKIYRHTRTISHDTREIALGDAFPAELKDELGSFYNTETAVIVKGLEDISWEKLSDEKCIAVHRGLKELLVNMRKHSQASLVAIRFEERKKVLDITYSDNGIGMDPEPKFGVGLKNTVSRIRGVQGKINFDSDMGKGTQIIIEIPF